MFDLTNVPPAFWEYGVVIPLIVMALALLAYWWLRREGEKLGRE